MAFEVTYNGLTISEAEGDDIIITDFDGFFGLPTRVSQSEKTGGPGGFIYNRLEGPRTITLWGYVYGDTIDDYFSNQQQLLDAFNIDEDSDTLYITRWGDTELTRRIVAKVIMTPMIKKVRGQHNRAPWQVQLFCPIPFFMDETDEEYTLYLQESGTLGGEVQTSIPMTLGGGGPSNRQVITNSGDKDWYLKRVRFSGNVNTPRLTNTNNSQYIYLDDTIGDGDYVDLILNEEGFKAEDQDGANVSGDLVGDFPLIAKGSNGLVFSAAAYSATASCTLVWANRYRSM